MADNYLEKKMEDRARAAAHTAPAVRRKGSVTFPFPERIVLAYSPEAEPSAPFAEATRALAEAGCRLALVCGQINNPATQNAAFRIGARLLPMAPQAAADYVLAKMGRPEILIVDGSHVPECMADALSESGRCIALADKPFSLPNIKISNAVAPANPAPARAAILLALPAATFTGQTL